MYREKLSTLRFSCTRVIQHTGVNVRQIFEPQRNDFRVVQYERKTSALIQSHTSSSHHTFPELLVSLFRNKTLSQIRLWKKNASTDEESLSYAGITLLTADSFFVYLTLLSYCFSYLDHPFFKNIYHCRCIYFS